MVLSRRERVRRAVRHEPVDRLPTPVRLDRRDGPASRRPLRPRRGGAAARFDNHLVRVDLLQSRLSADGRVRYDWWGAGHDTPRRATSSARAPLAADPDLDAFDWPDPWARACWPRPNAPAPAIGEDAFVVPNLGFALFERAWSLRGFEGLLFDLAADPAYVGELLDRITDIQLVLIERYLELGVDGGYFGDDYGAQTGLLFSRPPGAASSSPAWRGSSRPSSSAGCRS